MGKHSESHDLYSEAWAVRQELDQATWDLAKAKKVSAEAHNQVINLEAKIRGLRDLLQAAHLLGKYLGINGLPVPMSSDDAALMREASSRRD